MKTSFTIGWQWAEPRHMKLGVVEITFFGSLKPFCQCCSPYHLLTFPGILWMVHFREFGNGYLLRLDPLHQPHQGQPILIAGRLWMALSPFLDWSTKRPLYSVCLCLGMLIYVFSEVVGTTWCCSQIQNHGSFCLTMEGRSKCVQTSRHPWTLSWEGQKRSCRGHNPKWF